MAFGSTLPYEATFICRDASRCDSAGVHPKFRGKLCATLFLISSTMEKALCIGSCERKHQQPDREVPTPPRRAVWLISHVLYALGNSATSRGRDPIVLS
jgi:hypothetical protein